MKTFNLIFISLISATMIFSGTAMAQSNRGRRGADDASCVVPSRGDRADRGRRDNRGSDWNRNQTIRDYGRTNTYRGGTYRGYRNPHVGTYYKNRRRLPARARTVRHRGSSFHYLDGLFYQQLRRGFVVVNPPIGLQLNRRPHDAERVKYRGRVYFQSSGYWFMRSRNSSTYVLVRNPFR